MPPTTADRSTATTRLLAGAAARCWTAPSSTSMRCGWGRRRVRRLGLRAEGLTTAARGLLASSAGARVAAPISGWGCPRGRHRRRTHGGGTAARPHGRHAGAGTLPTRRRRRGCSRRRPHLLETRFEVDLRLSVVRHRATGETLRGPTLYCQRGRDNARHPRPLETAHEPPDERARRRCCTAPRPQFSSTAPPTARAADAMHPLRVLVIDNYDSFTFNLVQYLGELGARVDVFKNDAIDVAGVRAREPDGVLISPGPCTPNEAGHLARAPRRSSAGRSPSSGCASDTRPSARLSAAGSSAPTRLMHGKTSPILHDGRGLFEGLRSPFEATRYHSLIVERASLPACLEVSAWTAEGEIMGLRHRDARGRGRAVSPRERAHARRQAARRQLARAGRQARRARSRGGVSRVVSADFAKALAGLLAREPMRRRRRPRRVRGDPRGRVDAGAGRRVRGGAAPRGESAEAIAAAAEALRAAMTPVEHGLPVVVDTCGTGRRRRAHAEHLDRRGGRRRGVRRARRQARQPLGLEPVRQRRRVRGARGPDRRAASAARASSFARSGSRSSSRPAHHPP